MAVADVKIQDLAQSNGWNLIPLPIPVPPAPLLEQAVGYQQGEAARYLALWWEPCGDEVIVSDGYISFTGHWPGYLAYVQHRHIYPHLIGFNLGSSECEADCQLVIDRLDRTAYILPSEQAIRLLASQWEGANQPAIPQVLSLDDLEAVIQRIVEQWQTPSNQDVITRMSEDRTAVQALCDWLNSSTTETK
jgi:hypothetical protein